MSFFDCVVGVWECTFRLDHNGNGTSVGVVPVSKTTREGPASYIGQVYRLSYGSIYSLSDAPVKKPQVTFANGDAITVRLDLGASTVSFAKNGTVIAKSTVAIARGEAHYFTVSAFGGEYDGGMSTVTIESIESMT